MSHNIDQTAGQSAIAYVGETPWHGLGQHLDPSADMATWRKAAGLDWEARGAPVKFSTIDGLGTLPGRQVLYRSDTKGGLAVVSDRYQAVQPRDVMDFYGDLCQRYGFTMETAGALREGRIIWALAKTGDGFTLGQRDRIDQYVLLSTSYDGSMATTGRLTSVRVVCNNTLDAAIARDAKPLVSLSHRSKWDADKFRQALGFDQWAAFQANAARMAQTPVTAEQGVEFFLKVYHGLLPSAIVSEQAQKSTERTIKRLAEQYLTAPGAELETAKGTVWGLLNAVTHDIDFERKARDQGSRLLSSWFGDGNQVKARALALATEMATA